jgi:hypothetical protein
VTGRANRGPVLKDVKVCRFVIGHSGCKYYDSRLMPITAEARQRILANLHARRLPLDEPRRMYAGYGQGRVCEGCGEDIGPTQVEYEAIYEDGRAYRVHLACAGLWEVERSRRREGAAS